MQPGQGLNSFGRTLRIRLLASKISWLVKPLASDMVARINGGKLTGDENAAGLSMRFCDADGERRQCGPVKDVAVAGTAAAQQQLAALFSA